ncbi:MAG: hypothetical protein ACTTJE_07180 [Schwartzia sp. (in: firmicutes)]
MVKNAPLSPVTRSAPDPWQPLKDDLKRRRKKALYRTLRVIASPQKAHVVAEGRPRLMLVSNSYLGLVDEPRVLRAGQDALARYGARSGGSRLTTGNLRYTKIWRRHSPASRGRRAPCSLTPATWPTWASCRRWRPWER